MSKLQCSTDEILNRYLKRLRSVQKFTSNRSSAFPRLMSNHLRKTKRPSWNCKCIYLWKCSTWSWTRFANGRLRGNFFRYILWTRTAVPNCTDLKQAVKKTNGKKEESVKWRSWNMATKEHTESSWEETRRLKFVQIITVSIRYTKHPTHIRPRWRKFSVEHRVYSRAFPKM